jgi:hypothetical protein
MKNNISSWEYFTCAKNVEKRLNAKEIDGLKALIFDKIKAKYPAKGYKDEDWDDLVYLCFSDSGYFILNIHISYQVGSDNEIRNIIDTALNGFFAH